MKYLLLLALALAVLWLLRQSRRKKTEDTPTQGKPPPSSASPTEIVACAHCGVHLPRQDALSAPSGQQYCSAAHQREARDV